MSAIVVCGGGVVGLCAAMMLARDGHQVTVIEGDPTGPPVDAGQAWTSWHRRGVAQFHQPHVLLPRFRHVVDAELPGLTEDLHAAGCIAVDPLGAPHDGGFFPPGVADRTARPGDEAFRFVTGRRPLLESVVARAAEREPGVTVCRGARASGLVTGSGALAGVPHVAGVRTETGQQFAADLVIDATGRRTRITAMLADIDARPVEAEAVDSGFTYYTRYFTGPTPPIRLAPPVMPLGTITLLTLYGDNDTWSITIFTATADVALRQLRNREQFDRLVRAYPLQAPWLDGRAITDVLPVGGVLDRYHHFVIDGQPVVTGLVALGDAWACTNPSAGRGISVGLIHAQLLRHIVRTHLDDPALLVTAWNEATEAQVAPYIHNQIAADRARIAEMTALRLGTPPPEVDPTMAAFVGAANHDADVFRALVETITCLALPQEVLRRPVLAERINRWRDAPPVVAPGPDRGQLLSLLAS